ncbi:hypothetical protein C8R43DRAFT_943682 [Mycena crocata]|nr:hypothetical protein C8R43DRAFT_943682 [Mycena crocata]
MLVYDATTPINLQELDSDSDSESERDWDPEYSFKREGGAWALLLQEALMNDTSSDIPCASDFKSVALEAFAVVNAPAEILFVRDEQAPPRNIATFLYIHTEDNTGLLNHARATHGLAWASHSETVRQSACTLQEAGIDFADLDAGTKVAVGSGGTGLRGILQQAVGGGEGATPLSRTLGYHADTPALAIHLGREPVRRGVTVCDPDAVVDIDGLGTKAKPRWRMPYSHRNIFKDASPPSSIFVPVESRSAPLPQTNSKHNALLAAHSRFHILTCIVITDELCSSLLA